MHPYLELHGELIDPSTISLEDAIRDARGCLWNVYKGGEIGYFLNQQELNHACHKELEEIRFAIALLDHKLKGM